MFLGLGQEVPNGFAAALGELDVEFGEGLVPLRCVDHRGHQPWKGLVAEQGLEPGKQLDQVGPQLAGGRQGERLEAHVHGIDQRHGWGRPVPVDGGLAGPGAVGDGFHRKTGHAVVGEHLERRAQHPLASAGPAWNRGPPRSLCRCRLRA